MSPISLQVHEGTYLILTEHLKAQEAEMKDVQGKEITLTEDLPIDYLQGEWIIKKRKLESKYDTQVPEVTVIIRDYVGSIRETEIEAERFLFSGEIIIGDTQYDAYTKLDPVNIYAYPIRYISILKEDGAEPIFDIMVSDMDTGYELFVQSDLNQTFEQAFAINISAEVDGEYYETEDETDYLVRK